MQIGKLGVFKTNVDEDDGTLVLKARPFRIAVSYKRFAVRTHISSVRFLLQFLPTVPFRDPSLLHMSVTVSQLPAFEKDMRRQSTELPSCLSTLAHCWCYFLRFRRRLEIVAPWRCFSSPGSVASLEFFSFAC